MLGFVRVLREYERAVFFRFGRLLDPPRGPGLVWKIPIVDQIVKVDLRTITLNIPPQEVITKDNVPVRVNAVSYFKIVDPKSAMARQAEAERERRAKIINAEGEFQAAEKLKDAAVVIEAHPIALQLRYLQTLLELGAGNTSTIIFPAPIDLIRPFLERADRELK